MNKTQGDNWKPSIMKRAYYSLLKVTDRKDLSAWEHEPTTHLPVYGIYHIFCDTGWEEMVREQYAHLERSGLLGHTQTLFISCIAANDADIEKIRSIVCTPKAEIAVVNSDPRKFEFPALDYMYAKSQGEDFLFYYFHTKGITYQTFKSDDRTFLAFRKKIISWRRMMEYFLFDEWQVAVNTLAEGYETYGCYLFPPFKAKMYAGNFWWARSDYFRRLNALSEETKRTNRFMAEEWLLTKARRPFSAFNTVADLYFVNIPPTLYERGRHSLIDSARFFLVYTFRKYEKKWLGISYKKKCQERFQKLKG